MADEVKVTPTKGESLLIWRRRSGFDQIEAAREMSVNADLYREWENDKRTHDQPRKSLGVLKDHEVCLLLRRRNGMKQKQLAEELGVTRLWVIRMEAGEVPCDRLTRYWGV